MALNACITVALWLFYCLQCRPLAAFWNPKGYPDADCLKTATTYYVAVAFNIFTDFLILALPIRPLWSIQASFSRRLGVIAVVSVGGIAVIVSCLRVIVLYQFASSPDFTYILGKMVIISAAELDTAIMAANAPSLKAVWLKHVSGSLSDYVSTVRLSTMKKGKQAEDETVRRKIVPKQERSLPYSSSMNNLVERTGSYD